jgi:hypothetical protein
MPKKTIQPGTVECRQCIVLSKRILVLEKQFAELSRVNKQQLDQLVHLNLTLQHYKI